MSDDLDFYIQGRIEPGTAFHIVSKKVTETSDNNTLFNGTLTGTNNYWSTLGVQEKYVNIYDVVTDPFYYYDNTNHRYYYPLYLCDRGSGNVTGNTGSTYETKAEGTYNNGSITITTTGQGFKQGQTVNLSGSGTANANVTINKTNGVASVYNITNSSLRNGTVTITGTVSNPLFNTTEPVPLKKIVNFDGNNAIYGLTQDGVFGGTGSHSTIHLATYDLNTGTGLPSTPTSNSTPTTLIMTGGTEPPHPDLNLKSWDAIKNTPYVVYDQKYYYPAYLYKKGTSNDTQKMVTTIGKTAIGYFTFWGNSSIDSFNTGTLEDPNLTTANCMFYNPYDSLMDSLFKYKQNQDGTVEFQLVSAGHYMESAQKYEYMTYTESGSPTIYTLGMSSNPSDLKSFVLEPVGYNLNSSRIYAGVPYVLKINENITSLNYNFVKDIAKESATTYLNRYFKDGYSGTPSSTNFFGNANPPDYLNPVKKAQDFNSSKIHLYFIPSKETTYHLSTQKILTYLDYNASDMLLMSPQVYNVRPKILIDADTSYYTWREKIGQSTLSSELAFGTQMSGSFTGLTYNYCTGTDTCGKCFGKCDLDKVANPTAQCIYDSLSVEKFNDGEDTFTCDHERYYQKSEYVSNVFIENHSNTAIIIVLVIGIILATGFILYEERNRISKEFFHLKK